MTGTGVAEPIVKVKVVVTDPAAFVAPMVIANVPIAVGVPEMTPESKLRLSPAGSPVALKVVGLLLAEMV